MMRETPQPRDTYDDYEQGYQAQLQPAETYHKGGQNYSYQENEHQQVQYQETEQLQH